MTDSTRSVTLRTATSFAGLSRVLAWSIGISLVVASALGAASQRFDSAPDSLSA